MKAWLTLWVVFLAGCQSNKVYVQFLPNAENLEVAKAKCQMMSGSAERSVVAWGSPLFVATQKMANDLDNMERIERFKDQCMTAQGWRATAINQNVTQPRFLNDDEARQVTVLTSKYLAPKCGIIFKREALSLLDKLNDSAEPEIVTRAQFRAETTFAIKQREVGKEKACRFFHETYRENGLV